MRYLLFFGAKLTFSWMFFIRMTTNSSIVSLQRNLIEVKKYWDVTSGQKENVEYCSARQAPDGPASVFIPVSTDSEISLNFIDQLQSLFQSESIVLAIQDFDSSTIYYEVAKGLGEFPSEVTKGRYSESYLRNNRKKLVTEAMNSRKGS